VSKKIGPHDQNQKRSSIVAHALQLLQCAELLASLTGAVPVWREQGSTNEIVLYYFGTEASSCPLHVLLAWIELKLESFAVVG